MLVRLEAAQFVLAQVKQRQKLTCFHWILLPMVTLMSLVHISVCRRKIRLRGQSPWARHSPPSLERKNFAEMARMKDNVDPELPNLDIIATRLWRERQREMYILYVGLSSSPPSSSLSAHYLLPLQKERR